MNPEEYEDSEPYREDSGGQLRVIIPEDVLRDLFAMFALAGILASVEEGMPLPKDGVVSRYAYEYAATMLEYRKTL